MDKENQFKAQPTPVYPEKMAPKKSTKPLTHAEDIHLWTDDRAQKREAFERERRMKEQLIQEMMAEKAREDEVIRVITVTRVLLLLSWRSKKVLGRF